MKGCRACYVGETGRYLSSCISEHLLDLSSENNLIYLNTLGGRIIVSLSSRKSVLKSTTLLPHDINCKSRKQCTFSGINLFEHASEPSLFIFVILISFHIFFVIIPGFHHTLYQPFNVYCIKQYTDDGRCCIRNMSIKSIVFIIIYFLIYLLIFAMRRDGLFQYICVLNKGILIKLLKSCSKILGILPVSDKIFNAL